MADQPVNSPAPQRHLPLGGTFNLRDTGGYATIGGGQTRWHTLWRSDSLHRLSADEQQILLDLGIKTVIDLRHERETTQSPNVFAQSSQIHYENIPLMPTNPSMEPIVPRDLTDVYVGILENSQPAVKAVIEAVLSSNGAPVLIHCTVGKDRTGTIIALLLGAVGVPDETIVADYALTGQYIQPLLAELRTQAALTGAPHELYERMLASSPDLMAKALDYLHQKYGDVPTYLKGLGFTDGDLATLRAMLVTP